MDQFSEEDLLKSGKDCFERSDYKKAQLVFNQVLEINKDSTAAYFYLANIFHIQGEISKSISAFKKVLELDPLHTDSAISLSILYNDIGKYEEAKIIFEKANERVRKGVSPGGLGQVNDPHINQKFAFKHFELAEMYTAYNRLDEALFEYNKSIGLNPDNLEARIKIAKIYSKKGFTSKAIDELKKLRNEHPGFHRARIALGLAYYAVGNIIDAQNEWKKVLVKDPNNQDANMYLNLSSAATEVSLS